jgi:hypothetical protein
MIRFFAVLLFLSATTNSGSPLHGHFRSQTVVQPAQTHLEWVAETLKRMGTVKSGMTRNDLLKVFTTEGGISTRLQRTYVSRDCRYFKVDVEFETFDQTRDRDGRVPLTEDGRDIIVKISRPYLAFAVID